MSLTTYIHKMKDEKGISFRQLAIESKISYGNIMDIKNDRIAFPTDTILSKLSKYLGKKREDVLFEILEDDVDQDFSKSSLRYIAYLGANNYTITINPCSPNPFGTGYMYFDGCAYKKRSGNTFTVIDSWSHIKKEHWEMFKLKNNLELDRDSWSNLFFNENMYVSNILYFALCRLQQSDFHNIKEFVIIFDGNDHDMELVEEFVPDKLGFKIELMKY